METKSQLRRRHRVARAQLGTQTSAERAHRLAEVLVAEIPATSLVAGYMPMPGEPDVLPFLHAHLRRGGRTYLPVVAEPETRSLHWVRWDEHAAFQRNARLPVMEPVGDRFPPSELLQHAHQGRLTILVPALAVDRRGSRLGQGGGFYDTMFATHAELARAAQLLAVIHPEEVLAAGSFEVEDHDLRVRRAAAYTGVIQLSENQKNKYRL